MTWPARSLTTGLGDGDEGCMVSLGRCVLLNVQPALVAPHPSVEKRARLSVRQHTGTCFAPRERWLEVTVTGNPAMPARVVANSVSGVTQNAEF